MPQRVAPPNWSKVDVSDVFFEDAFRDALVGERPSFLSRIPDGRTTKGDSTGVVDDKKRGIVPGFRWSLIVSAQTIESEVKRLSRAMDDSISRPTSFSGGGYQRVRQQFSVLSVLFAIVHEYDGEIRWKTSSAAARDKFAYGASIARVGTQQVFNSARQLKLELADLVRGDAISAGSDRGDWMTMLDRGALMRRLEQSQDSVFGPFLASQNEMDARVEELVHEAELTAVLGQILVRDGMPEWDDETYADYCRDLMRGASGLRDAAKQSDYDAAVHSSGVISKSCSHCHETYRG